MGKRRAHRTPAHRQTLLEGRGARPHPRGSRASAARRRARRGQLARRPTNRPNVCCRRTAGRQRNSPRRGVQNIESRTDRRCSRRRTQARRAVRTHATGDSSPKASRNRTVVVSGRAPRGKRRDRAVRDPLPPRLGEGSGARSGDPRRRATSFREAGRTGAGTGGPRPSPTSAGDGPLLGRARVPDPPRALRAHFRRPG